MTRAPLLVIAVGNPSRGDDALGPAFVDRARGALAGEIARGEVELLTDFQLQIEHALDVEGRDEVVFVDASVSAAAPYTFAPAAPAAPRGVTHAMAPAEVLGTCRAAVGAPPRAFVLAIRGERFELGEGLSPAAAGHLDAALDFFVARARGGAEVREADVAKRLVVSGVVQGVGFRPFVARRARSLGLRGRVRNDARGLVVDAAGRASAVRALLDAIARDPPPGASVRAIEVEDLAPGPIPSGFTVAPTEDDGPRTLAIPPDRATCAGCAADVADAASRYRDYPFTTCTTCGPRLAIAVTAPFDREATTMAAFPPCDACRAEAEDPEARRFHAQTIACAACGPRAWLESSAGEPLASDDPVAEAGARVARGEIVGVLGVGALHLACDATSAAAVAELRRRKRREAQPLAVMARDLAEAEGLADLDPVGRAALTSDARPIVLAPRRPSAIAEGVTAGGSRVGVMLPYSPLHAALARAAGRPIVLTSGNPRGGPAVIERAEALAALGGVVDAFLFHDRPIARRVEDSVVAQTPFGARVVRRARGLCPTPIRLPCRAPAPILAVGGHQKSAVCLVVDDLAYLGPHMGDLDLVAAERAFSRDVAGFERLVGARPAVLAHDLHPDYATTRYALARDAERRIGVQHHLAHALAVVAERRIADPCVCVVYDGTGWGTDGTAWGGEVFVVDGGRSVHVATFHPLPLPGGERAIRDVWRVGLGALLEALGPERAVEVAATFPALSGRPVEELARAAAAGVGCPRARGVGRWFDAVACLTLGLARADYDGHAAIALEEIASPGDHGAYAFDVPAAIDPGGEPAVIDPRPAVRAAIADVARGEAPGVVSARFHDGLAAATASVVAGALAAAGLRDVALGGGAFANQRLEGALRARMPGARIWTAESVPAGDGGLALGQALAATLALRGEGS